MKRLAASASSIRRAHSYKKYGTRPGGTVDT